MGRVSKKSSFKSKKEARDPRQDHLDQLHMEFRKMEGKKKTSNEATQNNLRMQRQQIDKLRVDNDRLREDLEIETRQARATNAMSASSKLDRLKDEADEFSRKIAMEKKRKAELHAKIKDLDLKLAEQRDAMRTHLHGYSNSRDYNLRIQREIRRYESRLDKARIKYNEAQAFNNKLREQIDNLRKDRDSYDGIFKKLTKELRDKKEEVQRLISTSNDAYKSRSEAQQEMQDMKERADKEKSKFDMEWKDLGDTLVKHEGEEIEEAAKSTRRRGGYHSADDNAEVRLRSQVAASGERIANDKKDIHLSKEKVTKFEEAFEMIEKATKISDIDQLVKAFIVAEERNFHLFNEVNEITAKIDQDQSEVESLKKERDLFDELGAGVEEDKTRKLILSNLEKKRVKSTSKGEKLEAKHQETLLLITQMKDGIKDIFDLIECPKLDTAKELITEGLTETNMMSFLGIIEERTNDILEAYNKAEDAIVEQGEEKQSEEQASTVDPVPGEPTESENGAEISGEGDVKSNDVDGENTRGTEEDPEF